MSAFVGAFRSDGGADAAVHRMLPLLAVPAHGSWSWSHAPLALACKTLLVHDRSCDPFTPPTVGAVTVAFDGRLDNRDTISQIVGGHAGNSDPELVIAAYLRYGELCPEELEGDFAFALADTQRGVLLLARDAVGTRPLYYRSTADGFYCCSRVRPLLGIAPRPAPDLESIARLVGRPRSIREGTTFFNGVAALPAATTMVVTAHGQRSWTHWEADAGKYEKLNLNECKEEFRLLLLQSVRRRLRGASPAAVQVSGGLDSSSILCTAAKFDATVFGIYHGGSTGGGSDETVYLRELEAAGHHIERVPLLPIGYPDAIRAAVEQSELPVTDFFAATSQRAQAYARSRGVRILLNGSWADQVLFPFPPGYLIDALHAMRWQTVRQHLRGYPDWFADVPRSELRPAVLKSMLRAHLPGWVPNVHARVRRKTPLECLLHPRLLGFARAEASPVQRWSSLRTHHARALEGQVRSRFDALTMESMVKIAAASQLEIALPYLDRELISLLVGAPVTVQIADGVPKRLLRESLHGIVPTRILQRKDKGDYTAELSTAVAGAAEQVFRELRAGCALEAGFLDPVMFTGDLARLSQRTNIQPADLNDALARLYGVECWLQRFFRDQWTRTDHERERQQQPALQLTTEAALHNPEIVALG